MIYFSIIIFSVWRRWLGLGNSGPRWLKVSAMVIFMLAVASVYRLNVEGVVSVLIAAAYFLPSHDYGNTKAVLMRYGPGGVGYVIAKRFNNKLPNYKSIIDGWSAYGELWVGATFGLFYAIVFNLLATSGL